MDVYASYFGASSEFLATCPDVDPTACAESEIPDHIYNQRVDWGRTAPKLNVGLGRGWQLSLSAPVDLRSLSIDVVTLDGVAYQPPYTDASEWSVSRIGPSDGRWLISKFGVLGSRWIVGGTLGTILPFGKSEPASLGPHIDGLDQRPLLYGAGTIIPVASGQVILTGPRWGAYFAANTQTPLYANDDGYQSAKAINLFMGPTFKVIPAMQLLAALDWRYQGAEVYDGVSLGGLQTLGTSLTVLYSVSPTFVLQAESKLNLFQQSLDESAPEPSRQRVVSTVGVSWTFGRE